MGSSAAPRISTAFAFSGRECRAARFHCNLCRIRFVMRQWTQTATNKHLSIKLRTRALKLTGFGVHYPNNAPTDFWPVMPKLKRSTSYEGSRHGRWNWQSAVQYQSALEPRMGKLCRSFCSLRVSLFDFCGLRFCFVQLAPFEVSPSTFPPFEFFMDSFSHPKPKQRSLEIFRFSSFCRMSTLWNFGTISSSRHLSRVAKHINRCALKR